MFSDFFLSLFFMFCFRLEVCFRLHDFGSCCVRLVNLFCIGLGMIIDNSVFEEIISVGSIKLKS